jgi:Na+/H+-translocating membrane pyrophosphatase
MHLLSSIVTVLVPVALGLVAGPAAGVALIAGAVLTGLGNTTSSKLNPLHYLG